MLKARLGWQTPEVASEQNEPAVAHRFHLPRQQELLLRQAPDVASVAGLSFSSEEQRRETLLPQMGLAVSYADDLSSSSEGLFLAGLP